MPDLSTTQNSRRDRRLPQQRWQIAPAQPEAVAKIAQATTLSPLVAQVLLNRGLTSLDQVEVFLNPEIQTLPSPLVDFPDLALAVELLEAAIATQQPIAICGDYDADGMTSTALLIRALRSLGATADYAIPSRMQEGYGINRRIIEEFHQEGVQLVLTVDNGISALEPIRRARELGLTVIITDHHDLPPELPPANAILNPKLIAETSPYRGLAGVGVAYVLALTLAEQLGRGQELAAQLLELFTLGTIADLAPLTGVNRRWVKQGLQLLPQSQLPGVQALIQVTGLSGNRNLKPEAIGFGLGPRINAVGRLADPQIVIDLLTTEALGTALERAMQCEQINQKRQQLCQQIEQEAIALYEHSPSNLQEERVLVLVQPDWHHGVIGIVASRLLERYGVPVFIGTYEEHDPAQIRGSARGTPEFHVFEALESCRDLLGKFGGHKAAGGFSFPTENLAAVRQRLSQFARQSLEPHQLKPLLTIDAQADFSQLSLQLQEQLDVLHPCGIENPDPIFWTANVRILDQKAIGKEQNHLKVTVSQSSVGTSKQGFVSMAPLKAIAWRWGEYCPLPDRVDIAYKLRVNEWNGERTLELELVGVRSPDQALAAPTREFLYEHRPYSCQLTQTETGTQLTIWNADQQELAVQQGQKVGRLTRGNQVREVDVSQPFFFHLIKAALQVLNQGS